MSNHYPIFVQLWCSSAHAREEHGLYMMKKYSSRSDRIAKKVGNSRSLKRAIGEIIDEGLGINEQTTPAKRQRLDPNEKESKIFRVTAQSDADSYTAREEMGMAAKGHRRM